MTEHIHEHSHHLHLTLETLLTGGVMAVVCGFLGTFIILRRLSFLADTLAHGSVLGIGLGYALGLTPSTTLIPFSVLLGLGLTWIERHRKENLNSVTAVAFSGCVGFGVLLMHQNGEVDAHELMHILFGNFYDLSANDMILLLVFGLPSTVFLWIKRRQLFLSFLDDNIAVASGLNPAKYHYLFMICTALTIAVCLKLVGVVLVMALITIPSLIAGRLTRSLKQHLLLSPIIAVACTLLGLWASAETEIPTGPGIASICAGIYLVTLVVNKR